MRLMKLQQDLFFIFFPPLALTELLLSHFSHTLWTENESNFLIRPFLPPAVAVCYSVSRLYAAWAFLSHCQDTDFTPPLLDVWSSERPRSLWYDGIFKLQLSSFHCKDVYKYLIHCSLRRNLFFLMAVIMSATRQEITLTIHLTL